MYLDRMIYGFFILQIVWNVFNKSKNILVSEANKAIPLVYKRVQRLCSRITTGRMSHIIVKEFAGKGGNNSIDLNRGGTRVGSLSIFFSLDKDVLQEEDQANEFSAFSSSKALKMVIK